MNPDEVNYSYESLLSSARELLRRSHVTRTILIAAINADLMNGDIRPDSPLLALDGAPYDDRDNAGVEGWKPASERTA